MQPSQQDILCGNRFYWDTHAELYHQQIKIALDDFHYGPLIPGDNELKLLPSVIPGKSRCLELACGGAQNSIYLARRGATCFAVDISAEQLNMAAQYARETGTELKLFESALENLPDLDLPAHSFDLIHSTFGLCFLQNPAPVIQYAVQNLLAPGGVFLASFAHPLMAGEWLKQDDDEDEGIYLSDYFHLPPDLRHNGEDYPPALSFHFPLSSILHFFLDAGLHIDAVCEPPALPEAASNSAPYWSESWQEYAPLYRKIPICVIVKASLP